MQKVYSNSLKKHYMMPSLFTVRRMKKIKKFMMFTVEVIPEMLGDARKSPVNAEFRRLKGHHFY